MTNLLTNKHNVYSQTGEDGIIEAILSAIGERDRWCVEFGAGNGISFSNTRNLIENKGYSAVLIEADRGRYDDLRNSCPGDGRVFAINSVIGFGKRDGLDAILNGTPIPRGFDFCSIDIDGNDYHAWKAIEAYRPKMVCIEFNPTIPTGCDFVQPADPAINQGSGISALVGLGKAKGYELAVLLTYNAFFVRNDLYARLEVGDNSVAALREDTSHITYLFHGFDGTMFVHGNRRMLWNNVEIDASRLQLVPEPRKYMG